MGSGAEAQAGSGCGGPEVATNADMNGTLDGRAIPVHHVTATYASSKIELFSGPANELLQETGSGPMRDLRWCGTGSNWRRRRGQERRPRHLQNRQHNRRLPSLSGKLAWLVRWGVPEGEILPSLGFASSALCGCSGCLGRSKDRNDPFSAPLAVVPSRLALCDRD